VNWFLIGTFLCGCPTTAGNVKGWTAEELSPFGLNEGVECTACNRVHLVEPRSRKVTDVASNDIK